MYKDLLEPVTRVKKRKKKKVAGEGGVWSQGSRGARAPILDVGLIEFRSGSNSMDRLQLQTAVQLRLIDVCITEL